MPISSHVKDDTPVSNTNAVTQVDLPVQKTILGKLKKFFNKSKAEVISDAIPEESAKPFEIIFTKIGEDSPTCNKTFDEIKTAIENGLDIVAYLCHYGSRGTLTTKFKMTDFVTTYSGRTPGEESLSSIGWSYVVIQDMTDFGLGYITLAILFSSDGTIECEYENV